MVSTRALETAYLYEFWTFLVLGVWGTFLGCFWGPKNTPLDVSVLGGLASESAEMPEPEPAEPHFDPYIGARKLNFRTVWSFWDENLAMSIFSMRGI